VAFIFQRGHRIGRDFGAAALELDGQDFRPLPLDKRKAKPGRLSFVQLRGRLAPNN
jgi:hypothetical protein